MKAYIEPAYTEPAYIAETPRLHPALRFTFRPMLQEEWNALVSARAPASDRERERQVNKAIAERITAWDITTHTGEPWPITADNLRKLRPALYNRVLAIVTGTGAGDEDPESTLAEQSARQRLIEGDGTPGENREINDAKN